MDVDIIILVCKLFLQFFTYTIQHSIKNNHACEESESYKRKKQTVAMIYKGLRDKVKILGNSLILSGLAFKQGCFMGM